jgi:integrase
MNAVSTQNETVLLTSTLHIVDHERISTLPNAQKEQSANGSVMWAGPKTLGLGARSAGPSVVLEASNVTTQIAASQRSGVGAVVASGMEQSLRLADSHYAGANENVIETSNVDEKSTQAIHNDDARLASLTIDQAFAIVVQARAVVSTIKETSRARKDTTPSDRTLKTYATKCEIIDREMIGKDWASLEDVASVLGQYAQKKNSFYVMRAAVLGRAIKKLKALLKGQEAIQSVERHSKRWRERVIDLQLAMREVVVLQEATVAACLERTKKTAQRASSKKSTLKNLPKDWREKFLLENEKSPTYRDAGILLRHCGMRPRELETGVVAKIVGNHLLVEIKGAKVRTNAGQPLRTFKLRIDKLSTRFVEEIAKAGGERTFAVNKDSMRAHLRRLSRVMFPPTDKRKPVIISAYVFRHALATDLREQGWQTEKIAAVLGERCSETTRHYGIRRFGGSSRAPDSVIDRDSVQTTRKVRAPDRTGLDSIAHKVLPNKARKQH